MSSTSETWRVQEIKVFPSIALQELNAREIEFIDRQTNTALVLLAANGVSANFSGAVSSALTPFAAKTLFRAHSIPAGQ
jgi:hypothetical protein